MCLATPQQEENKGPVQPVVSSLEKHDGDDFSANSNIHKIFKAIYLSESIVCLVMHATVEKY